MTKVSRALTSPPLMLLLLLLLAAAQQVRPQIHGYPVPQPGHHPPPKRLPTTAREARQILNVSSSINCHSGSPAEEPQFLFDHLCPTKFLATDGPPAAGNRRDAAGIPIHRVQRSTCACSGQRGVKTNSGGASCVTVKLPVTELQPLPIDGDSSGRPRFVETVQLQQVGCAAVLESLAADANRDIVLTGKDLRDARRSLSGAELFRPAVCSPSVSPRTAAPSYSVRVNKQLRPMIRPVARCYCPGQVPVMLPITVLRLMPGGQLRDDVETVSVGCAVPAE